MAKVGNEYGSTTGRTRRCGWLDLVALKYCINLNGVTQLMMMKSDVLSGFDKVKICTAYQIDNRKVNYFPYNIDSNKIKAIYKEFPGWEEDLSSMTNEKEFPENLNNYINYLEKEIETPIKIVSVGPDRKQTIFR